MPQGVPGDWKRMLGKEVSRLACRKWMDGWKEFLKSLTPHKTQFNTSFMITQIMMAEQYWQHDRAVCDSNF